MKYKKFVPTVPTSADKNNNSGDTLFQVVGDTFVPTVPTVPTNKIDIYIDALPNSGNGNNEGDSDHDRDIYIACLQNSGDSGDSGDSTRVELSLHEPIYPPVVGTGVGTNLDLTDFIGHTIDLDEWLMLQSECLYRHCGTWEFIIKEVNGGYHVKGMTAR